RAPAFVVVRRIEHVRLLAPRCAHVARRRDLAFRQPVGKRDPRMLRQQSRQRGRPCLLCAPDQEADPRRGLVHAPILAKKTGGPGAARVKHVFSSGWDQSALLTLVLIWPALVPLRRKPW